MASESSVRVGLRVRPLVPREKGQGILIDSYDNQSLLFKGQTFTFDHVFGMELSQNELYERTAAPMLKSFLEGYNCTIMAYGQTGSGKTYTMGTADTGYQEVENQGLIPRFVADLFENLNHPSNNDEETSFKIKVSFLEIYGEDVFDLLSASARHMDIASRTSLPVREDENGKVFVQGQTDLEVKTPQSTLEALNMGSHNRVTAATAMNAGSSRSHAVFTIMLEQTVKSADSEDDVHRMTSRLTFVDLAGSERIKRTGAEGQRLKEGIQINSGLFNLGQVINCLADEQKLKSGTKSTFVPYRNSKLTHLLKDALGGNSQTLFLACVSPAESNESESHSTLNYARQARNIRNKPVRNMDKTQLELRRLKYSMKTWMLKAVTLMFAPKMEAAAVMQNKSPMKSAMLSPAAATFEACQPAVKVNEEALMRRPEVMEFINSVNASIADKLDCIAPSPRKVRLSTGVIMPKSSSKMFSPSFASPSQKSGYGTAAKRIFSELDDFPQTEVKRSNRESILCASELNEALEVANQIEGSEQLVERMLDMVNKEKKLLGVGATDSFDANDGSGAGLLPEEAAEEIIEVDRLIQEKEEILNKLLDNIKGYSVLKNEFEKLLDAINSLEDEKKDLEAELERAKKSNQSSSNIEKMKERFSVVKKELEKMRDDRKSKEQAYRVMQRESKQCDAMQKELHKLKEAKVQLMRQQKTQFQQMQKLKKESAQKISTFKKNDVRKQQQVNNLKSELSKKERILGLKEREIGRVTMKLKACEEHITQLLKMQNRNRNKTNIPTANGTGNGTNSNNASGRLNIPKSSNNSTLNSLKGQLDSNECDHLMTSKALLEQVVLTQVDKKISQQFYTKKVSQLKLLNQELLVEAGRLESLLARKMQILEECKGDVDVKAEDMSDESDNINLENLTIEAKYELESIQHDIMLTEDSIDMLSKDIDECNVEIDELSLRLDNNNNNNNNGDADIAEGTWDLLGKEIISGLSQVQSQVLVLDLMTDKTSLLEQIKVMEHDFQRTKADLESTSDRALKFQNHVDKLRRDIYDRVSQVEKQRIMDVWAILKAQKTDTLSTSDNMANEASQTSQQVAIQRASDLEKELETVLANEEELKSQLQDKLGVLTQAQHTVQELEMKLQLQRTMSSEAQQQNGGSNSNNNSQVLSEEYLEQLNQLWQRTGTSFEDRQSALDYLMRSNQLAQERTLHDAENNLKASSQDVEQCLEHLQQMSTMLGVEMLTFLASPNATPSLEDLRKSMPKLQALAIVHRALSTVMGQVVEKVPRLCAMKDQLLDLMSEMWLEIKELPAPLQALSHIKFNALLTIADGNNEAVSEEIKVLEIIKVAKQCIEHNVNFYQMNTWDLELKKLNLQRVQTTNSLIALRQQILQFMSDLELLSVDMLTSLLTSTFNNDSEVTPQTVNFMIQVLSMKSASNPPGAEKLQTAMDKVKMLLESVKVNRSTVADQLRTMIQTYAEAYDEADFLTSTPQRKQLLVDGGEECKLFARSSLQTLFATVQDISERLNQSRLNTTLQMKTVVQLMTNQNDQKVEDSIYQFLQKKVKDINRPSIDQIQEGGWKVVMLTDEVSEELSSMSMFLEENWIQESIQGLVDHWGSCPCVDFSTNVTSLVSVKILLLETYYLKMELKRLESVHELHNELRSTDATLIKQVVELEEFEHTSKENRAKALSGNSKLLIEEEKYRRNAKKKYEVITEKIVSTYAKLIAVANNVNAAAANGSVLSSPQPVNSDGNIEIKIDIASLSPQGQALCRSGMSKEKIELMRLNTGAATNAPTPVAASAPLPSPANTNNNTATTTASTGSSKRRVSMERENSFKKDSKEVSKPATTGLSAKSRLPESKLAPKSTTTATASRPKLQPQLSVATNFMLPDSMQGLPSAPTSTSSSASSSNNLHSPLPPAPPSIKSPKGYIAKTFNSSTDNKIKRTSIDENDVNTIDDSSIDAEPSPTI